VVGRPGSEAIAGTAGLGHMLLTAGLVLFFINLGKRITVQQPTDATAT
jgi:hypothetical protein